VDVSPEKEAEQQLFYYRSQFLIYHLACTGSWLDLGNVFIAIKPKASLGK
jgi:hypothetical protein